MTKNENPATGRERVAAGRPHHYPNGTRTMPTLIALLIALVLTLVPGPAAADEATCSTSDDLDFSAPVEESLCYPLPTGTVLAIDGPRNVWRMRVTLERLDDQLDGFAYVPGSCAANPAAFCIRVVKVDDLDGNDGLATWDPDGTGVRVDLRRGSGPRAYRRGVAAHELLHVLGIRHHAADGGLVGPDVQVSDTPEPSVGEWILLRAAYSS